MMLRLFFYARIEEPGTVGLRTVGVQLKELFFPRYLGTMGSFFFIPSRTSAYNYAADVGDGLTSSVVMPVVQWIMRSFPEAPVILQRRVKNEYETVEDHPLPQLLAQPNAFYSGVQLWMNTCLDWCTFGEAYWRILAARGGRPAELWWLPPWSIQPVWPADGSQFISHYVYGPEGQSSIDLPIEEVVHFRHSLDPHNLRHGLPPLRAILQDIWVDSESNNFVGAMLRNMGIPGLILSPKGDATLTPAEVERVKAYIQSRFTGDQRGQPLAMGLPTDVQKLSFSPAELDMSTLRNTAEERVAAALGIPAAVVGFGTGLETTKVGATMGEMRKLAWQNGIVPVQRIMAAELDRSLLPWYESNPGRFRVSWDYGAVQALAEDENAKATRLNVMVTGGWLKVSEARTEMGMEFTPDDEIYLRSSSVTPVDPKDQMPEPEPLMLPQPRPGDAAQQGNGNGNGAANGTPPGPGRGAVQQRALGLKQGTTEEFINSIIGRNVQRLDRPPASAARLANRLWRDDQKAQPKFQRMIAEVFTQYGSKSRIAAQEILFPQKQDLSYLVSASIIQERLPLASFKAELAAVYEELYAIMLRLTIEAIKDALDVEVTNPIAIETQLRNLARERVGLLDMSAEARSAILRTLEEAQAAGLDEDAMLKLLEDRIPAGRWGSVETRARIISRTESRLASNLSTSQAAKGMGANLLVFDSRLGSFDEPCDSRVGWIVTPAQAQALSAVEHISGTLGFGILTPAMVPSGTALT